MRRQHARKDGKLTPQGAHRRRTEEEVQWQPESVGDVDVAVADGIGDDCFRLQRCQFAIRMQGHNGSDTYSTVVKSSAQPWTTRSMCQIKHQRLNFIRARHYSDDRICKALRQNWCSKQRPTLKATVGWAGSGSRQASSWRRRNRRTCRLSSMTALRLRGGKAPAGRIVACESMSITVQCCKDASSLSCILPHNAAQIT